MFKLVAEQEFLVSGYGKLTEEQIKEKMLSLIKNLSKIKKEQDLEYARGKILLLKNLSDTLEQILKG